MFHTYFMSCKQAFSLDFWHSRYRGQFLSQLKSLYGWSLSSKAKQGLATEAATLYLHVYSPNFWRLCKVSMRKERASFDKTLFWCRCCAKCLHALQLNTVIDVHAELTSIRDKIDLASDINANCLSALARVRWTLPPTLNRWWTSFLQGPLRIDFS